jgi:hypothetical protein
MCETSLSPNSMLKSVESMWQSLMMVSVTKTPRTGFGQLVHLSPACISDDACFSFCRGANIEGSSLTSSGCRSSAR